MSADTKNLLLRLPPELAAELEAACGDEHLSATELVVQGLVIRLRMKDKSRLPALLESYGYQQRRKPGRPRKDVLSMNGSGPAGEPKATGGLPYDAWDARGAGSLCCTQGLRRIKDCSVPG